MDQEEEEICMDMEEEEEEGDIIIDPEKEKEEEEQLKALAFNEVFASPFNSRVGHYCHSEYAGHFSWDNSLFTVEVLIKGTEEDCQKVNAEIAIKDPNSGGKSTFNCSHHG